MTTMSHAQPQLPLMPVSMGRKEALGLTAMPMHCRVCIFSFGSSAGQFFEIPEASEL